MVARFSDFLTIEPAACIHAAGFVPFA